MSDQPEEPKIVVDEDWKSKVAAEKRAAEAAQQEKSRPPTEKPGEPKGRPMIPPASFPVLVTTLAAQAMTAMGKAPDPVTGHPVVRPDWAKHYIDTLDMLEEKTKGNLTPDEAEMLSEVLHQLRLLFVTTGGTPGSEK